MLSAAYIIIQKTRNIRFQNKRVPMTGLNSDVLGDRAGEVTSLTLCLGGEVT